MTFNEFLKYAGAVGLTLLATGLYWRWLGKPRERRTAFGVYIVIEIGVGLIAGIVANYLTRRSQEAKPEDFGEQFVAFFFHTVMVIIVLALGRSAHTLERIEESIDRKIKDSIQELRSSHARLNDTIDNDERIILARTEPLPRRNEMTVVAVERLSEGGVPEPLPAPGAGKTQWAETISVLRFDRLQDLLFSTDYLRHFLTISEHTKRQYRLLIVNDRPRSEVAVRSFLEMSDRLKIPTFVHRKGEFYQMLADLERLGVAGYGPEVRAILHGQPDLSTLEESQRVFQDDNYLLRYRDERNGPVKSYGRSQTLKAAAAHLGIVAQVLRLGLREDRRGLGCLSAVLEGQKVNPWSEDLLKKDLIP